LFLVAVAGCYKLAGNEPLLADWFTGVLRVPRGEMLAYVHMDFESIYEQDLLINVERGRVTGQRIQDNRDRFAWQRSAPARLHVTAREERVLRLRFGIGLQEHSVSELAEALGVTVQRIRRIEAKAFAKLKHRARRNWAEVLGFL
jgi:DNA-directed RNA polymerase specialized sigma subunit